MQTRTHAHTRTHTPERTRTQTGINVHVPTRLRVGTGRSLYSTEALYTKVVKNHKKPMNLKISCADTLAMVQRGNTQKL